MASGKRSRWWISTAMHSRCVVIRSDERLDGAGSLHEQGGRVGGVERADPHFVLAVDVQGLATRRHDPDVGTAAQDVDDDRGGRVDDVLAVVDDHGRVAVPESFDGALGRCGRRVARRTLRRTEAVGDRFGNSVAVRDRSELDEPDLVLRHQRAGELERQSGLAHPRRVRRAIQAVARGATRRCLAAPGASR